MGDLGHLLLDVAVILDIDAVGHDHLGDIARAVDIVGVDRDLYLSPVHLLLRNQYLL